MSLLAVNQIIEQLLHRDDLTPLSATILATLECELAADTKTFSQQADIAHALVIRECVSLAEEQKLIALDEKNERTQRMFYSLTDKGKTLLEGLTP